MSGVRLSRDYLPGMRARNWGRIIFISSESALQIPVESIAYGMSKAAEIAGRLRGKPLVVRDDGRRPARRWRRGQERVLSIRAAACRPTLVMPQGRGAPSTRLP